MTTRSDYHIETAAEFLGKAYDYLDDGDLLQASEKGWGAAAQMIKAVAEERGWRHNSHADLFRAVDRIANELDDRQLRGLFRSAGTLHRNFYEGRLPAESVAEGLDAVQDFARRLSDVIG